MKSIRQHAYTRQFSGEAADEGHRCVGPEQKSRRGDMLRDNHNYKNQAKQGRLPYIRALMHGATSQWMERILVFPSIMAIPSGHWPEKTVRSYHTLLIPMG